MQNTSTETPQSSGLQIDQNQRAWKFILEANSQDMKQLNRAAITDGNNVYTYRLMFRQWDRYASVFTALGMTGENHARVGVLGSASAETIFVMYALNMVGAEISFIAPYMTFRPSRLKHTIKDEKLTDFIITDDFAMPDLISDLLSRKSELGLRNIILLHITVGGPAVPPAMRSAQEAKYMFLKTWFRSICMDTLLSAYGDVPVDYISEESSDSSFILHTSGTTNGVGKPVVLSDKAFNAVPVSLSRLSQLSFAMSDPTSGLAVDLSNSYGIIDQVHVPLALGGTIAIVPGGMLNPSFYKAIPEFQITFLFAISAALEAWIKLPEDTNFDFSSLRCIVVGGAAVSAKDKQRYSDFLRKHGCKNFVFLNGYGISEMGGACCLSTPDLEDESIGYLLPGVELRLCDDDNGKYYTLENAPCEGILYLSSPSGASPMLDDKEILKFTTIDGKPFVCTNDYVSMDETGKLTYLGRARRYFINDKGRNFEAGKVEIEISRQAGIECCCVVPVFMKNDHDNIPMLCVQVLKNEISAVDTVRNVLRKVFVTDKSLSEENIPTRVLISPELPRNANGKLDLFGIAQGQAEGDMYEVKPIRFGGNISDIQLIYCEEKSADMLRELFDGIKTDLKDSLSFKKSQTNMEMNNMSKNNNPFMPFNPMGWMNQANENTPMPAFPMPNFQAMQQMAAQVLNLKMNQAAAYFNQMAQTGATMLSQLYMEHTTMVQQAAAQDKEMMKQFEKVFTKKEDDAEKSDKSAEKKAEKKAEEKAVEKAEKPAEKTEKPAEKKAEKPAEKKAEKPAEKKADEKPAK